MNGVLGTYINDKIRELAEARAALSDGMMNTERLIRLGRILASYRWDNGGIVAEIGTYFGHTAVFMAKVMQHMYRHDVPVLSIDPFERSGPYDHANATGNYSEYIKNVADACCAEQCFCIATFSRIAVPVVGPIGVLVVDGNHSRESCETDLQLYVPKVLPGGWIFVDDYIPDIYPGVVAACDGYFRRHPRIRVERSEGYLVAEVA